MMSGMTMVGEKLDFLRRMRQFWGKWRYNFALFPQTPPNAFSCLPPRFPFIKCSSPEA